MQAASRESLSVAREEFRAFAGEPATTSTLLLLVASQLRAVSTLLSREPGLRRALVDPGRDSQDRSSLLKSLLANKVDAATMRVLVKAVEGRWSEPGNLLDAVELLSIDAELTATESEGQLDAVEDELFRFSRIVSGSPALAGVLADSSADVERRRSLIEELLSTRAQASTVRLVGMALHGVGGRGFEASLEHLVELAARQQDRQIAYVEAASPLTTEQEDRLTARFSALYGRKISVKVTLTPDLLGGMTIKVGDDLYDGSIAHRLEKARAVLGR